RSSTSSNATSPYALRGNNRDYLLYRERLRHGVFHVILQWITTHYRDFVCDEELLDVFVVEFLSRLKVNPKFDKFIVEIEDVWRKQEERFDVLENRVFDVSLFPTPLISKRMAKSGLSIM